MSEKRKTPHPALVIGTLLVAAVSTATVFWLLASISFQIVPS